jgi:hypothetical protein
MDKYGYGFLYKYKYKYKTPLCIRDYHYPRVQILQGGDPRVSIRYTLASWGGPAPLSI